jgi:hypothetical protein
MDWDVKRDKILEFVEQTPEPHVNSGALSEALYSMSEMGLWPDEVDSVSHDQAIRIYKLVTAIMKNNNKFPDDLRM